MKNVMTRAWEIAKEAVVKFGGKVKEYFAMSLRMAWAEIKKGGNTMEEKVEALLQMGANKWAKGDHERLYFNQAGFELVGLYLSLRKNGNIHVAKLNGENITKATANRIRWTIESSYIDLKTNSIVRGDSDPENIFPVLVNAIENM